MKPIVLVHGMYFGGGRGARLPRPWQTHNPPYEVQRRAADLLRAEWRPIDSAHLPFFTHPLELASIIAERSQ